MRHYVVARERPGRPRQESASAHEDDQRNAGISWHSHPKVIAGERATVERWVVATVYHDMCDPAATFRHARCSTILGSLGTGREEDGDYFLYFCSRCLETVFLSEESQFHVPESPPALL